MKYYTRLGIYKASNVTFNPTTLQAYSYGWWRFVDVINGKVVFNSYRYSPSTGGHQSKVRRLLSELGIKVDIDLEAPSGLQDYSPSWRNNFTSGSGLQSSIALYERRIETLELELSNPRSRKAKNAERKAMIKEFQSKIKLVKQLIRHQERKERQERRSLRAA